MIKKNQKKVCKLDAGTSEVSFIAIKEEGMAVTTVLPTSLLTYALVAYQFNSNSSNEWYILGYGDLCVVLE